MTNTGARLTDQGRRRRRRAEIARIYRERSLMRAGRIVGRIKKRRRGRYVETAEADRIAKTMNWWRPGLLRDSDARWWIWRERVL